MQPASATLHTAFPHQGSISALLYRDAPRLIAFVGGGGKTSLMFLLANELASQGLKVITTTTTKMFLPTRGQVPSVILQEATPDFLRCITAVLEQNNHCYVARQYLPENGKLQGLTRETISTLCAATYANHASRQRTKGASAGSIPADIIPADIILVEADGAARKPLKAPADHEPVIPQETDLVAGVIGLDALGVTATEGNVFRAEVFCALTEAQHGEPVTTQHLKKLVQHPQGLFKNAPSQAQRCALLNKMDLRPDILPEDESPHKTLRSCSKKNSKNIRWIYGSALHNIFQESLTTT